MAFNLINFKKGTLASLETLKTNHGVEEGTFYLTIDANKQTSRLFIGTANDTALPINHSIITVTNPSDLNSSSNITPYQDGDFAYVTNGNILAVKKGDAWTQINGVDNSRIWSSFTPTVTTSNGTATISWAMQNAANQVLPDVNGDTPDITMAGANGITVSSSGDAITLTGTAYEMHSAAVTAGSNSATVKLQSKDSANGNLTDVGNGITISRGPLNNITITGTADNIVIDAKDTTLTSSSLSLANNATSGFDISIADSDNNGNSVTLDPAITLGTHTAAGDQYKFNSGVANLPVYTKDEIDDLLTDVDAMTYKGLINGSDLSNQTSGLHIGDTFKASTNFSLPQANSSTGAAVQIKQGDLLIVSSQNTEGSDGTISSTPVLYDVIPSGDDFYEFKGLGASHNGNGIQIEDGSNTVLSSIEIAAGSQMAVSSTHTDYNTGDGAKTVVTVAHAAVTNGSSTNGHANTPSAVGTAQATHSTQTFDVVTGLTTDNGHVTDTTVTRIQVTDTVSKIDASNSAVAVSTPASNATDYNKAATVTSTLALVDEAGNAVADTASQTATDLAFTLRSDNLQITASGTTITANYVWGQF